MLKIDVGGFGTTLLRDVTVIYKLKQDGQTGTLRNGYWSGKAPVFPLRLEFLPIRILKWVPSGRRASALRRVGAVVHLPTMRRTRCASVCSGCAVGVGVMTLLIQCSMSEEMSAEEWLASCSIPARSMSCASLYSTLRISNTVENAVQDIANNTLSSFRGNRIFNRSRSASTFYVPGVFKTGRTIC